MRSCSRMIAAAVGGLVLLPLTAAAQSMPSQVTRVASLPSGSIAGVVQDEQGAPIPGAMVSAFGATTAMAVTDRIGRFELRSLSPGPYLVRAHVSGYVGARGRIVEVRSSVRTASSIALRHLHANPIVPLSATLPVVAAGFGAIADATAATPAPAAAPSSGDTQPDASTDDDHGEVAWRLRHLRRGVLRDVVLPARAFTDDSFQDARVPGLFAAAARSAGFATSIFAGMPFSGQVNLLTTGSFDSPQQLFDATNLARGIADFSLKAPAGDRADWSMRGALTEGDLASWYVAGNYARRAPGRHRYDLGLSYSTQRYDGGNPGALRSVTGGSRNVGGLSAFDTFALTSSLAVTYGARFSRYDYLPEVGSGLSSPRVGLAFSPGDVWRVTMLASSRALAPGAEEFLPPTDVGLWLPPQRTFSSLVEGRALQPERTNHIAVETERDFGAATVSMRVFRQRVTDQLVTLFGLDAPGVPGAELGHYFVANGGDVDASGWSAGVRTATASRVHGSVEYSMTSARWARGGTDTAYLLLVAPSVVPATMDRVHALSTSVETNLTETSTRIFLMYRVTSSGSAVTDRPAYDSRFDVQVHQSLPFMDFSTARWEMLLAVRNTFRDASAESSVYDELLVSKPPKRIVGGLSVRF